MPVIMSNSRLTAVKKIHNLPKPKRNRELDYVATAAHYKTLVTLIFLPKVRIFKSLRPTNSTLKNSLTEIPLYTYPSHIIYAPFTTFNRPAQSLPRPNNNNLPGVSVRSRGCRKIREYIKNAIKMRIFSHRSLERPRVVVLC